MTTTLPATVERVGICRSKALRYTALFQRVRVKLSTKYRIWPIPGDPEFLEFDPSQWRDRYTILHEEKTNAAPRPS